MIVTDCNVNKNGFYKIKGDGRKVGYGIMELWNGLMTVKTENGCMNLRYMDAEEVKEEEGVKLIKWEFDVEDNRDILKWYYHENADTIFIGKNNEDHGNESAFIHELGICKEGTELELMEILCTYSHWENQDITKIDIDYNKPE